MELCMRDQERERLKVLEPMAGGLIGTDQEAARLGVRRRQAQRLLADDRRRGDRAAILCVQERRLEQKLALEKKATEKMAVDLTPCGQPGREDRNAGLHDRLSTGLEQPERELASVRVVHKLHSPDDDEGDAVELIERLQTPVRIINCTRKPSPDHPWR
jgi:hypothetical protein